MPIRFIFGIVIEEGSRILNLFEFWKNLFSFVFYGRVKNRFLRSADRASGAAPISTITLKYGIEFKGGSSILIFRGDQIFSTTYSVDMNVRFLESTDPDESVEPKII